MTINQTTDMRYGRSVEYFKQETSTRDVPALQPIFIQNEMISIRHSFYKTSEAPDLAFTRLNWTVERVDKLVWQMITNLTVSTNRPWVGVLEPEVLKFRLVEPRGFLTISPVQLIVKGKIRQIAGGSRLEVKIQPGPYTLFIFIALYLLTLLMLFRAATCGTLEYLIPWLVWTLVFPVSATVFLNYKVNQIDDKVKALFDATDLDRSK